MRRKGFTLIELLVVIAIIALLLAIIVPSLRKAKEMAKSVTCRSNLRQMSIAFSIYAQENDGRMFMLDYGQNYWLRKIAPYLDDKSFQENPSLDGGGTMAVSICPCTKMQTDDTSGNAPDNRTTWAFHTGGTGPDLIIGSYGINCWLLPDPGAALYMSWGGSQSDTLGRYFERYSVARADAGLMADAFRMDVWPVPEMESLPIPQSQTITPIDLQNYHDPQHFMRRYTVDRHGEAVNVAFVGGYVKKVDLQDLGMVPWSKKSAPVKLEFEKTK
jgi:prepilin-type N-terminal cleavage/methylation domain-containing protein/prepilin-type processing-associated H-X9-DG protein